MGGFLGLHNTITRVLDPAGVVTKVTGNNDPLNLFGGVTKANEEKNAKALEEAQALEKQKVLDTYNKKYGTNLQTIGGV